MDPTKNHSKIRIDKTLNKILIFFLAQALQWEKVGAKKEGLPFVVIVAIHAQWPSNTSGKPALGPSEEYIFHPTLPQPSENYSNVSFPQPSDISGTKCGSDLPFLAHQEQLIASQSFF